MKAKIIPITIGLVTLVLATVGIGTAVRLYQLRNEGIALNAPQSKPGATEPCQVAFDDKDKLYCTPNETTVVVTGKAISIPAGSHLQTSAYIVEPPNKRTPITYDNQQISSGQTFTVTGKWPGYIGTEEKVEIHFGLNVIDQNGNPVPNCTGSLDYFWGKTLTDQCKKTPTPTPTATPTSTPTATPTTTPTPSTLPNLCTFAFSLSTPTPTGTPTSTPTGTATPTATPTSTPSTPTETPTSTPTSTPTTQTSTPKPELPNAGTGIFTLLGVTGGSILITLAVILAL